MSDSAISDRDRAAEADTIPAPAPTTQSLPPSVPGLRSFSPSFVETLPPPGLEETPPAPPPASVPGARPMASSYPETLVPPPLSHERARTPEAGEDEAPAAKTA